MKSNIILERSLDFSVEIIDLYREMSEKQREYVLSKQILRSATSIGVNMHKASRAYNNRDFLHKCVISFKEAGETQYWLDLIYRGKYVNEAKYNELSEMCKHIIRILNSIIISTRRSLKNKNGNINKEDYLLSELSEDIIGADEIGIVLED